MKKLTKADILGADDIKTQDVEVPEWDGIVTVAVMSGTARDAFEESMMSKNGADAGKNLKNFRARLLASTLIDESGNLLFSLDEVEALGKKNGAVLDRLYDVAINLNRINKKDVDALTKNSEPDPSAVSTSV